MKDFIQSNRFRRDYKLAVKRQWSMHKLHDIMRLLASESALPDRCKPHKLKGNYFG